MAASKPRPEIFETLSRPSNDGLYTVEKGEGRKQAVDQLFRKRQEIYAYLEQRFFSFVEPSRQYSSDSEKMVDLKCVYYKVADLSQLLKECRCCSGFSHSEATDREMNRETFLVNLEKRKLVETVLEYVRASPVKPGRKLK